MALDGPLPLQRCTQRQDNSRRYSRVSNVQGTILFSLIVLHGEDSLGSVMLNLKTEPLKRKQHPFGVVGLEEIDYCYRFAKFYD